MKNISIIYWSGTGNTEAMAKEILVGVKEVEDVQVNLINVAEATTGDVIDSDAIAFGCPSMGAEQLEESEMEPFIDSISQEVNSKKIVLFGSYGWGNGEWMVDWQDRMKSYGANLITEGLILNNEPDEEGLKKCRQYGKILANS